MIKALRKFFGCTRNFIVFYHGLNEDGVSVEGQLMLINRTEFPSYVEVRQLAKMFGAVESDCVVTNLLEISNRDKKSWVREGK